MPSTKLTALTGLFLTALIGCKTTTRSQLLSDGQTNTEYPKCIPQQTLNPDVKPEKGDRSYEFDRSRQISPGFFEDMKKCEQSEFQRISAKLNEIKNEKKLRKRINDGSCEWRRDLTEKAGLALEEKPSDTTDKGDKSEKNEKSDKSDLMLQCHFHTAPEFMSKNDHPKIFGKDLKTNSDDIIDGELHCVFPDASKTRPTVFGIHVRCDPASVGKESNQEECSADVLQLFSKCQNENYVCCDRGSLTNPYPTMTEQQKGMSPDFRICRDLVENVDCSLLKGMVGHHSNAVDVGPEYEGKFTGHWELEKMPPLIHPSKEFIHN